MVIPVQQQSQPRRFKEIRGHFHQGDLLGGHGQKVNYGEKTVILKLLDNAIRNVQCQLDDPECQRIVSY